MINNIVNIVINKSTSLIFESKDKILSAGKKRAQEETLKNLPSPIAFKQQIESIQFNSLEDEVKLEKLYNKFINTIEKALLKARNSKNELVKIKEKLEKIEEGFKVLNDAIEVIFPLIQTIKGTVIPGIEAGLAASASPATANGLTINKLGEKKKTLKDEIKKTEDSIKSIPDIISFFEKEIQKLSPPLNKGISALETLITFLESLKAQIKGFYTQFIESLTLLYPELYDETFTNISEFIKDENNLSSIVTNVIGGGDINSGPLPKQIAFKKFN